MDMTTTQVSVRTPNRDFRSADFERPEREEARFPAPDEVLRFPESPCTRRVCDFRFSGRRLAPQVSHFTNSFFARKGDDIPLPLDIRCAASVDTFLRSGPGK
jgi:hypothetical protein